MPKSSGEKPLGDERLKIIGLGDTSIRKNYYGELKKRLDQLELFRDLIDRSNDFIILATKEDHLVEDINQRVEDFLGLGREDLLGRQLETFLHLRRGESLSSDKNNDFLFYAEIFSPGGQTLPVELSVSSSVRKRREYIVLVARDVTERLRAENELKTLNNELEDRVRERTAKLRDAQQKLMDSEKMVLVGSLVAGVSHEINTPLGVALTSASFVEHRSEEVSKAFAENTLTRTEFGEYLKATLESAQIAQKNLERVGELVQQFKQVAVDQSLDERREIVLADFIKTVLSALKPRLTGVEVKTLVPEGTSLFTYPAAWYQILTNLLMNSVIHGFKGRPNGKVLIQASFPAGAFSLVYEDDGQGVPPEHRNRLFEPFFTTNRANGGTGLGLPIVKNLVTQKLGGSLRFEPVESGGARFVIDLPGSC